MSEYASMEEVVEAFRSSTFTNPKLTFGTALEILQHDYDLSEDSASIALAPELVGTELLELWEKPTEEE